MDRQNAPKRRYQPATSGDTADSTMRATNARRSRPSAMPDAWASPDTLQREGYTRPNANPLGLAMVPPYDLIPDEVQEGQEAIARPADRRAALQSDARATPSTIANINAYAAGQSAALRRVAIADSGNRLPRRPRVGLTATPSAPDVRVRSGSLPQPVRPAMADAQAASKAPKPSTSTVPTPRVAAGSACDAALPEGNFSIEVTIQKAGVNRPSPTLTFQSRRLTDAQKASQMSMGDKKYFCHAEPRALEHYADALGPGDVMTITGEKAPCSDCKPLINAYTQQNGAKVEYFYNGKTSVFVSDNGRGSGSAAKQDRAFRRF